MQSLAKIDDKQAIEAFLRNDKLLHLYEIGDLDAFFWPYTEWHGLRDHDGRLCALAMLYTGMAVPTVLALERSNVNALRTLLKELVPELPERFHAHLTPAAAESLRPERCLRVENPCLKLGLVQLETLHGVPTPDVERLTMNDRGELERFYGESYPDNWFDPRMLETDHYFGVRERGQIVCVAGIHVYSPEYGVAALGNIATALDHRGKGLARRATAKLCQVLLETVDTIGLNVKADNDAAIACYRGLGFEVTAEYGEYLFESVGLNQ
ncbi:GNAT family N-acetyltransferase [Myxococcota bacterium]